MNTSINQLCTIQNHTAPAARIFEPDRAGQDLASYVYTLSVQELTCNPRSAISASCKNSMGMQTRWPLTWDSLARASSGGMNWS